MKHAKRIVSCTVLIILLLCIINIPSFAQEPAHSKRFPDGVIEVPQGTAISINDDNGTVTIVDSPVIINEGDTFVVYLQDLPIAYIAKAVTHDGNSLVITAEKADKSVYALLGDEEGVIELTPNMYEFIPADNVAFASSSSSSIDEGSFDYGYEDGCLHLKTSLGGSYSEVYLSNLRLSHSVSNGNISVGLSGNWGFEAQLEASEDLFDDLELGEIRIWGIGKIKLALSFEQSISLKSKIGGTFFVGVGADQDGTGTASKGFTVTEKYIEGKGSITASLKITAGIDVLVASADLYVNIGAETEFATKHSFDPNIDERIDCEDFKICLFTKVGAEILYYNIFTGRMSTLKNLPIWDSNDAEKPPVINIHFENGQLVSCCTKGMPTEPTGTYGGIETSFGSTLLTDGRDRVLETDIDLPWDMVVDQDLTLAHGNLDLNGHTLTVNGDLILSGGSITIGGGALIVHGDIRIQSLDNTINETPEYGDSTGSLFMDNSDGRIVTSGNLLFQGRELSLTNGVLTIGGDFYQINSTECQKVNLGIGLNTIFSAELEHTIHFDNTESCCFHSIELYKDLTIDNPIQVDHLTFNGFNCSISGNLSQGAYGKYDLSQGNLLVNGDVSSEGNIDINGGSIALSGDFLQSGGTVIINGGELDVSGDYYIAGSRTINADGSENVTSCWAALNMSNDNDIIRVHGDFLTCTSESQKNIFSAGTIYIGGDFSQRGTNNGSGSGFDATGTHKTVFDGNLTQRISFTNSTYFNHVGGRFAHVSFINHNIEFATPISGFDLENDIDLIISAENFWIDGIIRLNGHFVGDQLNTKNRFTFSRGTLDLCGSKVAIKGDFLQSGGTININGGELDVYGNYFIADQFPENTDLIRHLGVCNGTLQMKNSLDVVRINKSFYVGSRYCELTEGTLYLGGDYIYHSSGSVSGNHTIVFNGAEKQSIDMQSGNYGFSNVTFLNPNIEILSSICGFELNEDILLSIDVENFGINGELNLNGHSIGERVNVKDGFNLTGGILDLGGSHFQISGDFLQSGGTVIINGGELDVSGDYYIAGSRTINADGSENVGDCWAVLQMTNDEDVIRVGGDFLQKTGADGTGHFTAGTMYVGGNFTHLPHSNGNAGGFRASGTHKVVLDGVGKKVIKFTPHYLGFIDSKFASVELTQPIDMYTFEPNPCWTTIIEYDLMPDFILPTALTTIEDEALVGGAFIYVKLPDKAISIGWHAFADCPNLAYIYIPALTTQIDDQAFGSMQGLTILGKAGSVAETYAQNHHFTFIAVP